MVCLTSILIIIIIKAVQIIGQRNTSSILNTDNFYCALKATHNANGIIRIKECADKRGCYLNINSCDGVKHCRDGSDEEGCTRCTRTHLFLCRNKKCIDVDGLCNGFNECGDNSDESLQLCQTTAKPISSTTLRFDELKPRTGVTIEQWLYIICGTVTFVVIIACCCGCLTMCARHKTRRRTAFRRRQEASHMEHELSAIRITNDYTPEPQVMALARAAADRPPTYESSQQQVPLMMDQGRAGTNQEPDHVWWMPPSINTPENNTGHESQDRASRALPTYTDVVDGHEYVQLDQTHFIHRSTSSGLQNEAASSTEQS